MDVTPKLGLAQLFSIEQTRRRLENVEEKGIKVPTLNARRQLTVERKRLIWTISKDSRLMDVQFHIDGDKHPFCAKEAIDIANALLADRPSADDVCAYLAATWQQKVCRFCCEAIIEQGRLEAE